MQYTTFVTMIRFTLFSYYQEFCAATAYTPNNHGIINVSHVL